MLGLALAVIIAAPALADQSTATVNLKATVAQPPCVMTLCPCPVGIYSAVLWGCLFSRGTASSVEVYLQYGKTKTYGSETPHQTVTWQPCRFAFIFPYIFAATVNNLQPDTTYHFRAVAAGDGTSYGDDRAFRTLPQPVITVVSPNGGEKWVPGSRQTIKWTYTNIIGDVKIELLKNGQLYAVISNGTSKGSNGSGSYSWVIPSNQANGTDYKIRITSVFEPSCSDISNNNFTIKK